jgi:hypothetical protein
MDTLFRSTMRAGDGLSPFRCGICSIALARVGGNDGHEGTPICQVAVTTFLLIIRTLSARFLANVYSGFKEVKICPSISSITTLIRCSSASRRSEFSEPFIVTARISNSAANKLNCFSVFSMRFIYHCYECGDIRRLL